VADKLKELNPDFDGKVTPTVENNALTRLRFSADAVTDLSPVRALRGLTGLACTGSGPGKGRLADLWPLKGLKLTDLAVANTAVADLAPLEGVPLEQLDLTGTPVADLSPLHKLPLRALRADLRPERDGELLLALQATLLTVNGRPAAEFGRAAGEVARAGNPAAKKPKAVTGFAGRVVAVDHAKQTLAVELTQAVVTVSPWHALKIAQHQRGLLQAHGIRDPRQRMARIQEHMLAIAYYEPGLYRLHEARQVVHLQAAADVTVRSPQPTTSEAVANPRLPGVKAMPGFPADFSAVRVGLVVEVTLARGDAVRVGNVAKDAPLEVVAIVIVR
jgi:hypothetical protein